MPHASVSKLVSRRDRQAITCPPARYGKDVIVSVTRRYSPSLSRHRLKKVTFVTVLTARAKKKVPTPLKKKLQPYNLRKLRFLRLFPLRRQLAELDFPEVGNRPTTTGGSPSPNSAASAPLDGNSQDFRITGTPAPARTLSSAIGARRGGIGFGDRRTMANRVTTRTATAVNAVALLTSRPATLGFHRNGLTIDMGESTIYEDRAPTPTQKAGLEARRAQLQAALEPSTDAASTKAMLAMLASMPARTGEQAELKMRGEAYRMALDDLPAWAIECEARRVIRGETKLGRTFAPTPAEFREIVSDSLASLRSEITLIDDILRAKVVPAPADIYRKAETPRPALPDKSGSVGAWSENLVKDLEARKARRLGEAA